MQKRIINMQIIGLFVLLISIIRQIDAVNIHISNTFDPYRLECPDRFGVARITMQRMESVGGIRIDNMISVYCESLSKMFPSQRDFTETDLEKCRWTKYHEIPSNFEPSTTCHGEEFIAGIVRQESTMYGFLCCSLRDRKKRNCEQVIYNWPSQDEPEVIVEKRLLLLTGFGFKNGQVVIEHCDYEVKSQNELDREFAADAQRKLEKWREAQNRRSSSTNAASSGSSEIGAPAFSSPGTSRTEQTTADFRSSDKFLAVLSGSEEALPSPPTPFIRKSSTKKRKSFGPPGVTPKGFKGTISPKIESTEESEEEQEESISTTVKPRKRTKRPRLSSTKAPKKKKAKTLLKQTPETETLSASSSSQLSKEKSRNFSNETETIKFTKKSSRKTKSSTMSPKSASKSNENGTKIADDDDVGQTEDEDIFTTKTKKFSTTTKIPPLKSVEKSTELTPDFTVKMSDVKKLSQFMSKSAEKKNQTSTSETTGQAAPKSPASLENSDREVIYIDFPSGDSTDANFERKTATLWDKSDVEVEYLYFDETGHPVTPPPKNASVQLKSVTVEIQHENSPGDESTKILESEDDDERKKESGDTEKVEQQQKQSKINTKSAVHSTTTPKSGKFGGKISTRTTKSPIVAKATTVITTKKFSTTTTTTKRPPRRQCTKDAAAVHQFTGEIIACGQGFDVWTPHRCPENTACSSAEDSNFRLCCPL